jgi:hypothetical protein
MSAYAFESKDPIPVRVLSFHFAYGKMKTAISPHIFPVQVFQILIAYEPFDCYFSCEHIAAHR